MSTENDAKSSIMDSISKLTDLITTTRRPPPPETGDGGLDKPLTSSEVGSSFIKDIEALGLKDSIKDLLFIVKLFALHGRPWDDSQFQLEKLVGIMIKLPPDSRLLKEFDRLFISRLWTDINKPPNMLAGDYFRAADASNYSRLYPGMGRSYSNYARSVPIERPLPLNLPDPGMLFDAVMVRKKFNPHPSSISSALFHLATIITHDLFDSSPTDPYINQTSSYADLTPLYGRNLEQQMSVRQGRLGLLKPDTFADRRIILQPSGVGSLLVLFSRNHNYIAKRLLQINERGRFSVKDPNNQQELKVQDENLFQTARLVNCGFYSQTILHDYLHNILGLSRTNSTWFINPGENYPKDAISNPIPTGMGNQISLEFNYIYRWHSAISEADAKWSEDRFKQILGDDYPKPGKEKELTPPVFYKRMKAWREGLPDEPEKRTFNELKRIPDGELKGTFRDADLVQALSYGVEQIGGSFGANGIPSIFRVIEIIGITSARNLGVCTLNELRRFLNLQPHRTFEEMNPDKEVAEKLRLLYGHVDRVELYPGLAVEKAKPPMMGSGLSLNFTLSRGILADAVNLIRNDRFLTDDLNSHNLTNWGYSEIQSDPNVADGSVLHKVFLRNTTGCYKPNSVYAMFPFTIPSKTKENLEARGVTDQYDYSRPATNEEQQQKVRNIHSYHACKEILSDKDTFNVTYDEKVKLITGEVGHFLGFDDATAHDRDRSRMARALYTDDHEKFLSGLKQFFSRTTQELIDHKKITIDDGQNYHLDVVRDVCNLVPVHFVSEYFGIPLKTQQTPHGYFTEREAYFTLTIIFMYMFADTDPGNSMKLAKTAKQTSEQVHSVMQKIVDMVGGRTSLIQKAADTLVGIDFNVSPHAKQLIKSLMNQYGDSNLVTWNMIGTMSEAVALMGKASSLVIDFYLRPENKSHLEAIRRLAGKADQESEGLILGYVLEALRLNSPVPGLLRRASKPTSVDDGINGTVNLKKDDTIFLSFESAHKDPEVFPEPGKVNPRRPVDSYLFFGQDFHRCFGRPINLVAIPIIVSNVLKIKNLQRAPDQSGQINQTGELFLNDNGSFFPFPTNMLLWFNN